MRSKGGEEKRERGRGKGRGKERETGAFFLFLWKYCFRGTSGQALLLSIFVLQRHFPPMGTMVAKVFMWAFY